MTELLTQDEHEALRLTAELANLMRKIIGTGNQAEHDWNEAAQRIHNLQHMIMSQAAGRAYPDLYRTLGGWYEGTEPLSFPIPSGLITHTPPAPPPAPPQPFDPYAPGLPPVFPEPEYNEQNFGVGFKMVHPPGVECAFPPPHNRCSCGKSGPSDLDATEQDQALF